MSVSIVSEVWHEVKRYVNQVDRAEAAESLINILIDNDVSPDEIRAEFKGDSDIKRALSQYVEDHDEEGDNEDDDYEDDDY